MFFLIKLRCANFQPMSFWSHESLITNILTRTLEPYCVRHQSFIHWWNIIFTNISILTSIKHNVYIKRWQGWALDIAYVPFYCFYLRISFYPQANGPQWFTMCFLKKREMLRIPALLHRKPDNGVQGMRQLGITPPSMWQTSIIFFATAGTVSSILFMSHRAEMAASCTILQCSKEDEV